MRMAILIHRRTRFEKRLSALRRGDRRAFLAADRAQELIGRLVSDDLELMEEMDRRTKHGEMRIDKCLKYDLGGGYRLVCVRLGEDLIITHVGSHDDCDRWIENNRRFDPDMECECESLQGAKNEARADEGEPDGEELNLDYDDILMKKVDQKTLRRVFCGLCGD